VGGRRGGRGRANPDFIPTPRLLDSRDAPHIRRRGSANAIPARCTAACRSRARERSVNRP
jgi:hypothetical protein